MYNLIDFINAYNDNSHLINAYLNNKSIEGFDPNNPFQPVIIQTNSTGILGMAVGVFIFLLLIQIGLFFWSLVLIINSELNTALKILLIFVSLFIPSAPLFIVIILLCIRKPKPKLSDKV